MRNKVSVYERVFLCIFDEAKPVSEIAAAISTSEARVRTVLAEHPEDFIREPERQRRPGYSLSDVYRVTTGAEYDRLCKREVANA